MHTVLRAHQESATVWATLRVDSVFGRMFIGDWGRRRHALVRVLPRAGRRQRRGRWCPTITESALRRITTRILRLRAGRDGRVDEAREFRAHRGGARVERRVIIMCQS